MIKICTLNLSLNIMQNQQGHVKPWSGTAAYSMMYENCYIALADF